MKRIIAIVLTLAIVFTCAIVPVAAAENEQVGYTYTDLLDLYSYVDMESDYNIYSSSIPSWNGYASYVDFSFHGIDGYFYSDYIDLYFTISSDVPIDSVSVIVRYEDASEDVLLGSLDAYNSFTNGSDDFILYHYYFDIYSSISYDFCIEFSLVDEDDVTISILDLHSSYSSYSARVPVDNVALRASGVVQAGGEGYYTQTYFDSDIELPYTLALSVDDYGSDPPVDDFIEVFVDIYGNDYIFGDQLVLTFLSTGVWDNYYDHDQLNQGGLTLTDFNGDIYNIPINAYYGLMDSSWYGLDVWRVTVVADLSGYDHSGAKLTFSTRVNGMYHASTLNTESYFFRLESCYMYFDSVQDIPWYKTFFFWIHDEFIILKNNIKNNFDSLRNRMVACFQNIEQALDTLFDNWESVFSTYYDRLEDILLSGDSPVPDFTDKQEQMQGVQDDMDSSSNDLENFQNEMDELMPSMPSWDDTGLGDLAVDYSAHISQILTIFTAIYENTIITQIITYAFLFALGGFILFGER